MENQNTIEEQVTNDAVKEMQEVSWDDAITSGKYIKFQQDKEKRIVITNWKLVKVEKTFQNKTEEVVEFIASVMREDGKECTPEMKIFSTISNRLKAKLKPILEGKEPKSAIEIAVIKIGDKFDTQYSVRQVM